MTRVINELHNGSGFLFESDEGYEPIARLDARRLRDGRCVLYVKSNSRRNSLRDINSPDGPHRRTTRMLCLDGPASSCDNRMIRVFASKCNMRFQMMNSQDVAASRRIPRYRYEDGCCLIQGVNKSKNKPETIAFGAVSNSTAITGDGTGTFDVVVPIDNFNATFI